MHAYATVTSPSVTLPDDMTGFHVYRDEVPQLALQNDALMHAVFSFTALHLAELHPEEAASFKAIHQDYYVAALRAHARELSGLDINNYDAACMTSSFMRLIADVKRRDRPLEPYTPPIEWFNLSRQAMHVFYVARRWHDVEPISASARLRRRMPFVWDTKSQFDPANQAPFQPLLGPVLGDNLTNAAEDTRTAYERVVSYVGGVWLAVDSCSPSEVLRRLAMMPFLVGSSFADLLARAQPRALVVAAHYFAIMARFREIWWIGNVAKREVQVLTSVLDDEWQSLLEWPLAMVNVPVPAMEK
jgi:hypothetical protein